MSTHCGGVAAVATPLYVGERPARLPGAFVQLEAYVGYDASAAATIGATVLVPFRFMDGMIAAPPGEQFWMGKESIGPPPPQSK